MTARRGVSRLPLSTVVVRGAVVVGIVVCEHTNLRTAVSGRTLQSARGLRQLALSADHAEHCGEGATHRNRSSWSSGTTCPSCCSCRRACCSDSPASYAASCRPTKEEEEVDDDDDGDDTR